MRKTLELHAVDNGKYESLFSSVSAEQRKPANQLIFILLGFSIAVSSFTIGVNAGNAFSFVQAAAICAAGNLIMFLMALFWGMQGYRSGYTQSFLLRNLLGSKVANAVSVLFVFVVAAWIGINGEWCTNVVITFFPGWPLPHVITLVCVIAFGILISLRGWNGMKWVSRICVPLMIALTVWHIVRMGNISNGFTVLYEPAGKTELTVSAALVFIIGNFSFPVLCMPDLCRYAKNKRTVWGGLITYALTSMVGNVIGILLAKTTGANNLVYGTYLLDIVVPSFLWLFASIYTTQIVNIYIGSIAMQNLLSGTRMGGNISRSVMVVMLECLAMLITPFVFSVFLLRLTTEVLSMMIITLTEIAMIETVMRKRRKPVNANLPFFTWLFSIIAGAVAWIFPGQYNWLLLLAGTGIIYILVRSMDKSKIVKEQTEGIV